MGEVKQVSAVSLKKGSYVILNGKACVVRSNQVSRPGKHGHAKCRIEAISIIDGAKKITVVPGHDKMESPIIAKENAQVLSIKGDTVNVMDLKSYETFDLKIPDELKGKIKEGGQVLYWIVMDDKIIKQVK